MTEMQKEYLRREEEIRVNKLKDNKELIDKFILKLKVLSVNLEYSNFNYIPKTGIVVKYNNILKILNRNIDRDKEGLVKVSDLLKHYTIHPFIEGLFYSKDYIVLCHQYFRRGFHEQNYYAPSFIREYWNLDHDNTDSYIAIDFNCVRVDVNLHGIVERDRWFGSEFKYDISSIKDSIIKCRPPLDIDEFYVGFLFNNVYSLDIKWATKGHIKSFQAKEFKIPALKVDFEGEEFHPVRYIHAEFDLKSESFRHFDGAIHLYNVDEYLARIDSDFNHNYKDNNKLKSKSFKLFKLNGNVNKELWSLLSSHFLSKNPLFYEYVNGGYPDYLIEYLDRIRSIEKN